MADQLDASATSARLGRLEAESFDLRLRERERQELCERWPHIFASARTGDAEKPGSPPADLHTLHQLEQLVEYQRAVQNSWPWRIAQALRRPFGRQW